jgi:hypothetical protein
VLLSALAGACAPYEVLPDARGTLGPRQRLVVNISVSPGPWIVDASDSKVETAAKLSPLGFIMQSAQDSHTLKVSRDLQQYMPRPHYGAAVQESLLKALRTSRSTATVQTIFEAGIAPAQIGEWNRAKDQLDWRQRYYLPDPASPTPRDYARALTLDDALILDVNLSYGTTASDEGQIQPQMSAASRVYRGDTSRLIWEHEDEVVDKTSSSTLSEFKLQPAELTGRIEKLAPQLASAVATSFVKSFGLVPVAVLTSTATSGGLLSPSFLQSLSSPTTSGLPVSVSTPSVSISTGPPGR